MLKELLDTRVMVKHAMKGVKSDKVRFYLPESCLLFRACAIGFKACARCTSAEFEVHLQRHVRLHRCNFLGEDARSRNRRQHRAEWPRDARKGES